MNRFSPIEMIFIVYIHNAICHITRVIYSMLTMLFQAPFDVQLIS